VHWSLGTRAQLTSRVHINRSLQAIQRPQHCVEFFLRLVHVPLDVSDICCLWPG